MTIFSTLLQLSQEKAEAPDPGYFTAPPQQIAVETSNPFHKDVTL